MDFNKQIPFGMSQNTPVYKDAPSDTIPPDRDLNNISNLDEEDIAKDG